MTPRALDVATVQERLRLLEDLLGALTFLGEVPTPRLRAEVVTRLAVERVLTQAVDLVVSVCSHVASAEGHRAASTYRDAITDAAGLGLVDEALAASLRSAVGMRNVLAHEYARADLDQVAAAVPVATSDLSSFLRQVAGWLARREGLGPAREDDGP